jgi:hypothetical protein
MKQPEGFEVKDSSWAAKLQKGLYGMKQGGRCWYKKLDQVLQREGFRRLRSDASIFVWEDADSKVIIPVFVDDITLVSKSKPKIQMLKVLLVKLGCSGGRGKRTSNDGLSLSRLQAYIQCD